MLKASFCFHRLRLLQEEVPPICKFGGIGRCSGLRFYNPVRTRFPSLVKVRVRSTAEISTDTPLHASMLTRWLNVARQINAVQMGSYLLSLLDEAAEPSDPPQPNSNAAATTALVPPHAR